MSLYPPHPMKSAGPDLTPNELELGELERSRTPSPTPSEAKALAGSKFDWSRLTDWRFYFRREWAWYYPIGIIALTLTILLAVYHDQIVDFLRPAADWMHDLPGGWAIPVAILFVMSFPPLFGHEFVAMLCGLVWGLWVGFGIVAAGTFLGEVANFYAFKYWCTARGEKFERKNLFYACLAQVVREGGFKIALIVRLSAIPSHFTTAVFSTCGMGILVFILAAFLSLPKQLVLVYLGVILEESSDGSTTSGTEKIAKYAVIGVTAIITIVSLHYINKKVAEVKPQIIYQRRKARQVKPLFLTISNTPKTPTAVYVAEAPRSVFNPQSTTSLPYQTWDNDGIARKDLDL